MEQSIVDLWPARDCTEPCLSFWHRADNRLMIINNHFGPEPGRRRSAYPAHGWQQDALAERDTRTLVRLGEAAGGSRRFVARPFCELGPASTDQVLGVIGTKRWSNQRRVVIRNCHCGGPARVCADWRKRSKRKATR